MSDQFESFSPPAAACFDGGGFSGFAGSVWSPGGFSDVSFSTASASDRAIAFNTNTLYNDVSLGLYRDTAAPTADAAKLDAGKSITQNIEAGNLKKTDDAPPEHQPVADKAQPSIKVEPDKGQPCDFKVKADGTIEVHGDPEQSTKPLSEYKIAVEEGADKKQTDALVSYLKDRLTDQGYQPTLNAGPGLVSDAIRDAFKKKDEDSNDINDNGGLDNNDGGCDGGGCDGGGGGGGGGGGDDTNLDTDDGKDNKDGGDKHDGNNDSGRKQSGYDALRNAFQIRDGNGNVNYDNATANSLGAYSMNVGNWFVNCLTPEMLEELGDPPDWSKLGKVLKKHANDPKFKAKLQQKVQNMKDQGDEAGAKTLDNMFEKLTHDDAFAEGFGQFLQHQSEGKNATPEEMKTFFGKDVQDAMMGSQISDNAKELHIDLKNATEKQAADLALASIAGTKLTEEKKQELMKDPNSPYRHYVDEIVNRFKQRGK
jgi:hypothetical protein